MTPDQQLSNLQTQLAQHQHTSSDGTKGVPFTNLSDVPNNYKGQKGNVATVNNTETGLVFAAGGGGGDMETSVYDPAGIDQQLVGISATQTITNKTLTNPTITEISSTTNNSIEFNAGTYTPIQFYTPSASTTETLDLSKGNIHFITMPAGNITIAISNVSVGQAFIVDITQDGTGSRTVSWFSAIRWTGGTPPMLTTTAGQRDTLGFICVSGGDYDGYVVGQNI